MNRVRLLGLTGAFALASSSTFRTRAFAWNQRGRSRQTNASKSASSAWAVFAAWCGGRSSPEQEACWIRSELNVRNGWKADASGYCCPRGRASLGYAVLEAEDARSALDTLETNRAVDLLLTDIIMPGGLSGADLGRHARQLRPNLKLIYMSGFPEAAFGDRADLDPNVILLRKPFRKPELGKRIREVLRT